MQGIPNEEKLPKLHVISGKHMEFLKNETLMNQLQLNLNNLKGKLEQEKEKIHEKEEASVLKDYRETLFQTQ